MEKEVIKKQLREFLFRNFMLDPVIDIFSDDVSLVVEGIVDSSGLIELATFIEETWSIQVKDNEITMENFGSLNKIAEYISRKI